MYSILVYVRLCWSLLVIVGLYWSNYAFSSSFDLYTNHTSIELRGFTIVVSRTNMELEASI